MKKFFFTVVRGLGLTTTTMGQKPLILAKAQGQDCEVCYSQGPGWSCESKILNVSFVCEGNKCQKTVRYIVCIPPSGLLQTKKEIDWNVVTDSLRREFSKLPIVQAGSRDTIIVLVENKCCDQPIIVQQPAAEEKKDSVCVPIWELQPYLSAIAGWTSDKAHFANPFLFGGKGGIGLTRENCRKSFFFGNLSYVMVPSQYSKETLCGTSDCELQQVEHSRGLQVSFGVGKELGNGFVFFEANSPLVWPIGELVSPAPDQGVWICGSLGIGPKIQIGTKIGGSPRNLGGFLFLTARPFKK